MAKARIVDNSQAFVIAVEIKLDKLIKDTANFAVMRAKQLVPVRTGTLQESITAVIEKYHVLIGSPIEYAGYVELGTSKMPARPYLRPAMLDAMNFAKSKLGAR